MSFMNTDNNDTNQIMSNAIDEMPLSEWLEAELGKNPDDKRLIIRKTTVAYAAAELLQKSMTIAPLSADKISLDNFVVRTKKRQQLLPVAAEDILGVDMISEKLSLTFVDTSDLGRSSFDAEEEIGRNLVVSITCPLPTKSNASGFEQIKESTICHLFGILLFQIYSNLDPFLENKLEGDETNSSDHSKNEIQNRGLQLTYSTLRELGSPSNICTVIQNLIECKCGKLPRPRNTYSSLKEGSDDLHLLLLHPNRLLFTSNAIEDRQLKLRMQKKKLYGRDHEVSLINDAFSRVCAGESVALFVGGFSGSGKTRLVESVMTSVDASGGYVLAQKFDQLARGGPLLELISAFDRLCVLIQSRICPQDLQIIVDRLTETYGADLSLLRRLLPKVAGLMPPLTTFEKQRPVQDDTPMNLQSVCFILQNFVRAVSSRSHPVVIFLDDLQWCNSMALEVIQHILCDKATGASNCFFVGSYRSNEVTSNHAVSRLMKELQASKLCSVQKLMLDGVKSEDLNALISDELCLLPRATLGLSSIIHQKTEGNPFFFLEFLRSLVDRDLLKYSLDLNRWEWDEDLIRMEKITNNVLFLLANKMSRMKEDVQMALRVLSSFGNDVNEKIISYLNTTSKFANILAGVEEAISDGYVSKVGEPLCYTFVHDKVKEAAYSLIPDGEKEDFHCMLGEALRSVSKEDGLDDNTIITIVDQINHNLGRLKQRSLRLEVASLNHMAGLAAMSRSDYGTASTYLKVSLQLLPADHWQSNYHLSLDSYMATAKVACASGDMDKSDSALKAVFREATSLEDKVEAYYLHVNLLHSQERGEEAHLTCEDILSQLGESIPDHVTPEESEKLIQEAIMLVSGLSEEKLVKLKEADVNSQTIMRFLSLLGSISYFSKPELLPYLNLRTIQLTMEHGLCKYSLVGLVGISIVLCNIKTLPKECVQLGYKIGGLGMSMLRSKFDYSDIKSRVDHAYSYVLQHSDPVQKCADRARKGYEIGIASGDTVFAFLNANGAIRYSILSGSKLPDLLLETDKYLTLLGRHGNTLSRSYMLIYRDTISFLIDNGENTSRTIKNGEKDPANEVPYLERQAETLSFHKVLQSFWLGYNDRCYHYSEKLLETKDSGKHHRLVALFYHGLNSFVLLRKGKFTKRCAQIYKIAHNELKEAEALSKWNYRNKVYLLEAEKYSYQGYTKEARSSYGAAMMAARCARFPHEQGLACELAAFHCKRNGDFEQARKFFEQARICYDKWGSSVKVESVSNEIAQISFRESAIVDIPNESA